MTGRTRHPALHPITAPGTLRRLVTVGQLSVDQLFVIDTALTVGDQHLARQGQSLGGTAAIVAHNAAALGAPAIQFCGHVGRSIEHRQTVRALQRAGITVGATVTTEAGLRVCIIVEPGGERTMVASDDVPDWSQITLAPTPGDTTGRSVFIHNVTGGVITFTAASSIIDDNDGMLVEMNSGGVVDFLGTHQHLAVDLQVSVDATGGLQIRSGEQRLTEGFVRCRVPATLSGTATLHEWYDEAAARFRIDVRVTNRRFGPIFGYTGSFTARYVDTNEAPVPAAVRPLRENPYD